MDNAKNPEVNENNSSGGIGFGPDQITSIIRQKIIYQLLLIDNVLDKIQERNLTHEELISELLKIEELIMHQINIFNFKFYRRMSVPEGLKAYMETQLFTTKRERVKVGENTSKDIALLEKELRQLWKETFDLLIKSQALQNG